MNKTKSIKLFAGGLVVLLGISSADIVKAYDNIENKQVESSIQINTIEIQKTLNGYLSNKWEESKESKIIENEYVVSDSLQEKYDKLKAEYENKWRQEIGEKIQWYKLNLDINSIDNINELFKVNLI